MKALFLEIIGSRIEKQLVGGSKVVVGAEVYCTFDCGGEVRPCRAKVKITTGNKFKDTFIEVSRVKGLPPGAKYDHAVLVAAARQYYTKRIVKKGD